MRNIPMIAISDFQLDGRAISVGERITVKPIDAAVLNYRRRARFTTATEDSIAAVDLPQTRVIEPEPPPVQDATDSEEKPRRRRQRSRRRDIVTQ